MSSDSNPLNARFVAGSSSSSSNSGGGGGGGNSAYEPLDACEASNTGTGGGADNIAAKNPSSTSDSIETPGQYLPTCLFLMAFVLNICTLGLFGLHWAYLWLNGPAGCVQRACNASAACYLACLSAHGTWVVARTLTPSAPPTAPIYTPPLPPLPPLAPHLWPLITARAETAFSTLCHIWWLLGCCLLASGAEVPIQVCVLCVPHVLPCAHYGVRYMHGGMVFGMVTNCHAHAFSFPLCRGTGLPKRRRNVRALLVSHTAPPLSICLYHPLFRLRLDCVTFSYGYDAFHFLVCRYLSQKGCVEHVLFRMVGRERWPGSSHWFQQFHQQQLQLQ